MKKWLAMITCALLLLTTMPVGILPVGAKEEMTLSVSSASGMPGDTVQITVSVANNPGLASLRFNVAYDSALTLTKVEFNSAFGSMVTAPEPYKNPEPITMISPLSDVTANGVFATLTFKVAQDAPAGLAAVSITYDAADIFDGNYDEVPITVANGGVTVGNVVSADALTLTVSEAAAAPGEEVSVNVSVTDNPGLASLKFNVAYDSALTLTKVEFNSAFGSMVTAPEPYKNPEPITMISPLSDVTANGVFATLTFKVAQDAPAGLAAVSITYDAADIFDGNYDEVPIIVVNGGVTVENCDHVDADGKWESNSDSHFRTCACGFVFDSAAHSGGTATCTETAQCEICGVEYGEVNAANHTVVIVPGYVATCGADGLTDGEQCSACGVFLVVQMTIPATGKHTYDSDKDIDCNVCGEDREGIPDLAGDVNSDGKVNNKDLGRLQQYVNGWDVSISASAADVNGDGKVNNKDLGRLQQYVNGWDVELG
ncbi:MAG: hypothetical protein IKA50_01090 [Clostridia bacterium]|nr:hypothetical protein [Clostridia bacterium]